MRMAKHQTQPNPENADCAEETTSDLPLTDRREISICFHNNRGEEPGGEKEAARKKKEYEDQFTNAIFKRSWFQARS